jgi:hypothetical protein
MNPGIIFRLLYFILVFLLFSPALSSPQEPQEDPRVQPSPLEHREIPEDEYIPVPREGRQTSPAYRFFTSDFFTVQVNVDQSGLNIMGDAANEPSIAMDPTDPNRITIGWRQFDTISSNFRQAGYGYTVDGGQTWTFPGVIEPGVFRSDPVLDSDSQGIFYYNSLTSSGGVFSCQVFKSTDGGATWDGGTFARGGDKQWMVIDKTPGIGEGHIYAYWTQFFSVCFPGFFTRSVNGGLSYEDCITIPDEPRWGTLSVGPNGELYVGGAGDSGFVVAKSSNAQDSTQAVIWEFSTSVNLDGQIVFSAGPNPGGLLGQAWIATDHSGGSSHGNVYLLCSVEQISTSDPLDVMFARSTDGGITWSSPVRVNDDPGNSAWQWFGTMSVAPDGRIDVIWLDTRDNPGSFGSSLYYSYSTDAGVSWSANERLTDAFDPHLGWPQQNKMGDYFHMISDETGAHLAWANTFNGEQDVYYSHIAPQLVAVGDQTGESGIPEKFSLAQNYPNPFNPVTHIRFGLPKASRVKITVYNIIGQQKAVLVNERKEAGYHTIEFAPGNLASGLYLYRIEAGEFREVKKMLFLK